MGTMKAALVKVVKKAKKVLSVMPMGSSGSDFPLWTARTVVMTCGVSLANTIKLVSCERLNSLIKDPRLARHSNPSTSHCFQMGLGLSVNRDPVSSEAAFSYMVADGDSKASNLVSVPGLGVGSGWSMQTT